MIHSKSILPSIQSISSSTWISSSFFNIFEILLDGVAAINSSLGIETDFKGPTLYFPMSRVQFTWPLLLGNFIQLDWPYPLKHESEKWFKYNWQHYQRSLVSNMLQCLVLPLTILSSIIIYWLFPICTKWVVYTVQCC